MEIHPEHEPLQEREPTPTEVVEACAQITEQLCPDADPQDVEQAMALLHDASDFADAFGMAVSYFADIGVDTDEGMARLQAMFPSIEDNRPAGDNMG